MIFIKKHDFGVTIEMAKALLVGWDIEWERGGGVLEKGDIMFGSSCGGTVLRWILGRIGFPRILERNAKYMVIY